MVNERLRADMAAMVEGLQDQLHGIAELQQQRSLLTATATACAKRIEATVNADGILVDLHFDEELADLSAHMGDTARAGRLVSLRCRR